MLGKPADLTHFNTLGLACQADKVVVLHSLEQLEAMAVELAQTPGLLLLGGGSNVILPSQISHLVMRVNLKGIELVEERAHHWVIDVAAGENWHDWVTESIARGWLGLENLGVIPGSVGAAPVQNIGAYGVELAERVESVTAWQISKRRYLSFSRTQCEFDYRDSFFKRASRGDWLIVSVRFLLPKVWQPVLSYPDLQRHPLLADTASKPLTAQRVLEAVCEIRRRKLPDPSVLGNVGSFFKNPIVAEAQFQALKRRFAGLIAYPQEDGRVKLAAGWLIEQCGLKGRREGSVGVHERQALVLVNYGGAQAADLMALAQEVAQTVQQTFGVTLEIEPVVVRA